MRHALLCAAVVVALAACAGKKAADDDTTATATGPTTAPAQKTVIDTQLKALQKAKDVQKTVDQQKADLDKKLEDQGG